MARRRIAIIFDGTKWYVRRIAVIEHDTARDHKVYRCDLPIGNDLGSLADVPHVAALISAERKNGLVQRVEIFSEKGGPCQMEHPFDGAAFESPVVITMLKTENDHFMGFLTEPGQHIVFTRK